MGPVSFESIEAGTSRADALERAERLARAGIRILSVTEKPGPDGPAYRLVIGAADAPRARVLLATPA